MILLIRTRTNPANSHNFANTHIVISKLSKHSDFTETQINRIVEAYISNNQINWIIGDDDVRDFIEGIISGNEDNINSDNLAVLKQLLSETEDEDDLDF